MSKIRNFNDNEVHSMKFFAKAFVCLVLLMFMSSMAHADVLDFLQISCSKELSYFSLRTVAIEPDQKNNDRMHRHNEMFDQMRRGGLYFVNDLLKYPYICKLPKFNVSVEIANFVRGSGAERECSGIDTFDVLIRIDNQEADSFSAYGMNRCLDNEAHLVEIDKSKLESFVLSTAADRPNKQDHIYKIISKNGDQLKIKQTYP